MIVHYTKIKGQIKDGKLEIELPDNVTDGEVILQLPVLVNESDSLLEERPLFSSGTGPCEDDPYYLDSAVIVRLMRTSIWDVCRMVQRDLED